MTMSWRALLVFVVASQSCANVECVINSDCGDRALCSANHCVRECVQDRDCADGMSCDPNGQCRVSVDAGADVVTPEPDVVMSKPDVVIADTATVDAVSVVDRATPADVRPTTDVPTIDVPAFDTPLPDVPVIDTPSPDVVVVDVPRPPDDVVRHDVVAPDASGPVPAGVYEFIAVRPDALVNPQAVAWHPSGAYALVLSNVDEVYRYDVATNAVRRVAGAGRDVAWRALTFTPDGARALLLGNTGTTAGTPRGRMFVWDHAASTLTERTDAAVSATFEAIRFSPDRARAAILHRTRSVITVRFVDPTGAATGTPAARGMPIDTSCNDLAWVTDGFGDPAIAIACGVNTGALLQLTGIDTRATFTELAGAGATGNVSRVASRPQADLAIAIGSSSSPARLYRYRAGHWDTGFFSPAAVSAFGVAFNDDGSRALAFGGFGVLTEYRHDLYTMAELTEARIDLAAAPYVQSTQARVGDLAWRPGCDEGLVVGGESSLSRTSAFVARFRALNGRRCP